MLTTQIYFINAGYCRKGYDLSRIQYNYYGYNNSYITGKSGVATYTPGLVLKNHRPSKKLYLGTSIIYNETYINRCIYDYATPTFQSQLLRLARGRAFQLMHSYSNSKKRDRVILISEQPIQESV